MKEQICGEFGFIIEAEPNEFKTSVSGTVAEITAIGDDSIETEDYLSFTIKWDSCCHFNFRDSGYIHFCGASTFDKHEKLLRHLYKRAFQMMGREPEGGEQWGKLWDPKDDA